MTTTETTRPEVEIDRQLAVLYGSRAIAADRAASALRSLHSSLGLRLHYQGRSRQGRIVQTEQELREMAAAKIAAETTMPWQVRELEQRIQKLNDSQFAVARLQEQIDPLAAKYQANPWSRFFLVPGGHIHSSMRCSTCRPTTAFGWLPELSGLTERDAVEAHGPLLCSVCYPTAPVEWRVGPETQEDPNRCPGSGKVAPPSAPGAWRKYRTCPDCGGTHSVTTRGVFRAHRKAAS